MHYARVCAHARNACTAHKCTCWSLQVAVRHVHASAMVGCIKGMISHASAYWFIGVCAQQRVSWAGGTAATYKPKEYLVQCIGPCGMCACGGRRCARLCVRAWVVLSVRLCVCVCVCVCVAECACAIANKLPHKHV
jgi:hypothetical protein